MYTAFEELNLFVYYSVLGLALDGVIWCLGPLVDDSRDYGFFRWCLALATRRCCRGWMGLRELG